MPLKHYWKVLLIAWFRGVKMEHSIIVRVSFLEYWPSARNIFATIQGLPWMTCSVSILLQNFLQRHTNIIHNLSHCYWDKKKLLTGARIELTPSGFRTVGLPISTGIFFVSNWSFYYVFLWLLITLCSTASLQFPCLPSLHGWMAPSQ